MEETKLDVADCLRSVRRNDQAAARALVEHLYPLVIKIARSNLPRRVAEEDLAQEIFMKMFAKLEQYRGDLPFAHWVSRIAVNTCLNHLRAQRSRPEMRWADLSEEEAGALDAVMSSAEEPHPAQVLGARELVGKLMDTLQPKDRLIIQMLDLEDRSVSEIRAMTGWMPSLIRVRAFRARRKMRDAFARLKKEERV
ncbi:MAG: RNA polymerase sigma factor [Verrucomicrobia bacterium]|nr:RNA polymerase sigma factor [Verrucomicrobiota bacterium]